MDTTVTALNYPLSSASLGNTFLHTNTGAGVPGEVQSQTGEASLGTVHSNQAHALDPGLTHMCSIL